MRHCIFNCKSRQPLKVADLNKPFKIDTTKVYFLDLSNKSTDDYVRLFSYIVFLMREQLTTLENDIRNVNDDDELSDIQDAFAAKMKILGDTLAEVNRLLKHDG